MTTGGRSTRGVEDGRRFPLAIKAESRQRHLLSTRPARPNNLLHLAAATPLPLPSFLAPQIASICCGDPGDRHGLAPSVCACSSGDAEVPLPQPPLNSRPQAAPLPTPLTTIAFSARSSILRDSGRTSPAATNPSSKATLPASSRTDTSHVRRVSNTLPRSRYKNV